MNRVLARAVVALVTTAAMVFTSATSATAAPHSGPNWTWAGPASWDASYGTYGITVLGNAGATLDLGFSSTICSPGATWDKSVKTYFKAMRKNLKNNGWKLKAGKIAHPAGFSELYRRQVLTGTNNAQGGIQGAITLDYDFTTTVDGLSYCYQRSLAKYAKATRWKGLSKTLNKVQKSLAYSGPGAPEGEDPDEF